MPQALGYSQSMSMPSNTPAAAPVPPAPSVTGRLPRIYALTHEVTNATRFSGRAALANPRDQVQPPSEISTLMLGYLALSCLSWFQLPRNGWSQVSATPLTLSAALNALE